MNASEALSRTILLARKDLLETVDDDEILGALMSVRVLLVADQRNLSNPEGQYSLVAAATLAARSGAACYIDAPNLPLRGVHPLLRERRLVDALLELGEDLVPGQRMYASSPRGDVDLVVVIGDTPSGIGGRQRVVLSADAWEGLLSRTGVLFSESGSPFGALGAAALAASEAYKHAMRRLRPYAAHAAFDDFFRETSESRVTFGPKNTPPPSPLLGSFDTVSGGAIVQSALYALCKIPGASGTARVIEPDTNAISNVNRYQLLRRCFLGESKASSVATLNLGGLRIMPVETRYDEYFRREFGQLGADVLVGVDNVKSRWAVEEEDVRWIGVGATEDYQAFRTYHEPGLPCTRCIHLEGSEPLGEIPAAAFVSFCGGLSLAAAFALHRIRIQPTAQVLQFSCLQLGSPWGMVEMPGVQQAHCSCRDRRGTAA